MLSVLAEKVVKLHGVFVRFALATLKGSKQFGERIMNTPRRHEHNETSFESLDYG